MGARDCFCGCGTKVKRRHVPYNRLGDEMSRELDEWSAARDAMVSGGLDFPLGEFLQEGAHLRGDLVAYMHTGTRPESLDLSRAGLWNEFSRKERRKLEARVEQLVVEGELENVERSSEAELVDVDEGLDYAGALSPSRMLDRIDGFMSESIDRNLEAVLVAYLREGFEELEWPASPAWDLLLTEAWAGYCTRSIVIEEVEEARDESPLTSSILEWNQAEGEPMFLPAIRLAGASAGFEGRTLDDLSLRAGWIAVPGVAVARGEGVDDAVLPFERLALSGGRHAAEAFSEGDRLTAMEQGVTNDMLKSSWLLGYFLRVNEQFAPVADLFAGAYDFIYGTGND